MKVLTTILSNLRNTLIGFTTEVFDQELKPIYIKVEKQSIKNRLRL